MADINPGALWAALAAIATAIIGFFGGRRVNLADAKASEAEAKSSAAKTDATAVEVSLQLVNAVRMELNQATVKYEKQLHDMADRHDEAMTNLSRKVSQLEAANVWYRRYNQKLIVQLHENGIVPVFPEEPAPEGAAPGPV